MSEDLHARAKRLIFRERVEELSADERQWLSAHTRDCAECAEWASSTVAAIRSLRSVSVPMPKGLASRTQMRVRLRAQQLQRSQPRWRVVWIACGISWAFGGATAPYIWRVLEWAGHRLGVPNVVWEMGFGLWWALPAAVAGLIVLITTAGVKGEADWKRERN
jgi:anti-sigma factor RsiW